MRTANTRFIEPMGYRPCRRACFPESPLDLGRKDRVRTDGILLHIAVPGGREVE
jgi:hypothetical protein